MCVCVFLVYSSADKMRRHTCVVSGDSADVVVRQCFSHGQRVDDRIVSVGMSRS